MVGGSTSKDTTREELYRPQQEQEDRQREWINNPQYVDVVEFKIIYTKTKGILSDIENLIIRKRARSFHLIDNYLDPNELAFIKRSRRWSRCIYES